MFTLRRNIFFQAFYSQILFFSFLSFHFSYFLSVRNLFLFFSFGFSCSLINFLSNNSSFFLSFFLSFFHVDFHNFFQLFTFFCWTISFLFKSHCPTERPTRICLVRLDYFIRIHELCSILEQKMASAHVASILSSEIIQIPQVTERYCSLNLFKILI